MLFKVNFASWGSESVFSQFSRLASLDFLRFVMAITIVREVTGNRLTGLRRHRTDKVIFENVRDDVRKRLQSFRRKPEKGEKTIFVT